MTPDFPMGWGGGGGKAVDMTPVWGGGGSGYDTCMGGSGYDTCMEGGVDMTPVGGGGEWI